MRREAHSDEERDAPARDQGNAGERRSGASENHPGGDRLIDLGPSAARRSAYVYGSGATCSRCNLTRVSFDIDLNDDAIVAVAKAVGASEEQGGTDRRAGQEDREEGKALVTCGSSCPSNHRFSITPHPHESRQFRLGNSEP